MKSIPSHLPTLLALFLSLGLCLFAGCSGGSDQITAKTADEKASVPAAPKEETAAAEETTDTAAAPQSSNAGQGEATTPESPEPAPEAPAPAPPGGNGLADHAVSEERLSVVLDNIAAELEAQNLEYRSDLGQDCSGIYHKIKDLIQKRIKDLGDKSKYTYPVFTEDRNTRQIANWYHRHNNLYIVKDALADRNKIRPGSVMFFSRTDEKFNGPDIATLTNAEVFQHDAAAGKGKIYHVGVVTNVERDEQGNVVRYTLMHGRNSKYTASRTDGNWDGPGGYGKAFAKFPFGNWNQQWVAVANIETPAN
ncbi:MAG: hypothetical protein H6559_32215 [Lewinellaceae bacterium]|nr:hypothetical protein [Lewinellaceae bacterium]